MGPGRRMEYWLWREDPRSFQGVADAGGVPVMKTSIHLGPLYREEYPEQLIKELSAIRSSDAAASYAVYGVPVDDRTLNRLLCRLRDAGLEPRRVDRSFDPKRHFKLDKVRRYDSSDLTRADLLQLHIQ